MLFLIVLAFFLGVLVGKCRVKTKAASTPVTNAQNTAACTPVAGAQSEAASQVNTEPIIDVELERNHEYEVIGLPETRDVNNFQSNTPYGTVDPACSATLTSNAAYATAITTLTSNAAYGTDTKALMTSNVSYGASTTTVNTFISNSTYGTTALNNLTSNISYGAALGTSTSNTQYEADTTAMTSNSSIRTLTQHSSILGPSNVVTYSSH